MKPRLVARLDVAAASGLVRRGDDLFVIADDELTLHRYDLAGRSLGSIALFEDKPLPEEYRARKKLKPDLEALALLPDGSLLALGSGSRANRDRAVCLDPARRRTAVDLAPLYSRLRERVPALNVEGAVVLDDALLLAHRDNRSGRDSAIVVLDLARVADGIRKGALDPGVIREVVQLPLERSLAPTDLAVRDGQVWFSAAGEATDDPYEDGRFLGSALGCLRADLTLDSIEPIEGDWKIEGLAPLGSGWLMVADADDRSSRAPLLST